ncbi:MAG: Uma2 family endonuclease [Polyangiaceae bacterium]
MTHVGEGGNHGECLHLPRTGVRFPVEWRAPDAFRVDDASTWPRVEGRLEYVNGRIRYMPPCGGIQQDVASDVTALLVAWARSHPELVVGSNEAGMLLGGEARGADAAVWARAEAAQPRGFRRVPPILAVEIAGQDEDEDTLRDKARWYLEKGVSVIWLVLPDIREVVVITADAEGRHGRGAQLPEHAQLPGLMPEVNAFFWQLDRGP